MTNNKPIITRYRPETFDEVLGHTAQIAALQRVIASNSTPHAYLLTGPSGTGKTTLARIIGAELKADIHEIDAASNNGVDAMRDLVEFSQHQAFTDAGTRLIIIDECFVKGTRVNTPNGYQAIETLRANDWIIGATGKQQIKKTIRNKVPLTHIVQLHLANGRTILCSDDHAFLTESGWIAAKDTANVKSIQTIHTHISRDLLAMWDCNYEQRRGKATLSRMRSTNLSRMRNKLLEQFQNMFSSLREYSCGAQTDGRALAGVDSGIATWRATTSCFTPRQDTCRSILKTNDNTQPYARSSKYSKNDQNKTKEWNTNSHYSMAGRKWSRTFKRTVSTFTSNFWANGIHCNYTRFIKRITLSECLQNRYSFSNNKTCNRSGWWNTSTTQTDYIGSEERRMPSKFRVESITYLQQTDIERLRQNGETCFVNDIEHAICYDLEIKGHPSYSVEDLIVHNCHTLSKAAWQAILKLLEDPPEHLYLALCTTEDDKIPDTIRTRCFATRLSPVAQQVISEYLAIIAETEEWTPSQEIIDFAAEAADGSPRMALTILQGIHDAPSREEAARITRLLEPTSDLIDILRHLLDGKRSWAVISAGLKKLDGMNFDEVSIQAGRYLSAALLRSDDEKKAVLIWQMLDALMFPVETFDRKVAFITSIGRVLWGGN